MFHNFSLLFLYFSLFEKHSISTLLSFLSFPLNDIALGWSNFCEDQTFYFYQVAVEELFYFRNQTTVIPVAQARGVIVLAAQKYCGCGRIFEYTPMQIKQALTGNGRADKKQMQFMVKNILGLASVPKPDDAADALAVAICHSQINPRINFNMM